MKFILSKSEKMILTSKGNGLLGQKKKNNYNIQHGVRPLS
jgi:hypothetical protein